MKKYTVLLLRPDYQREGHQSDWIFRAHVEAESVEQAFGKAQDEWARFGDEENPQDAAPIAVYEGHLFDLFQA